MIHIAYHESYKLNLPDNHKFPMKKYSELSRLLIVEGLFSKSNFFTPDILDERILHLTHEKDYISNIKNLTLEKLAIRKIGFPLTKELYEREMRLTEGTVQGAIMALDSGLSYNIAGGTHHAFTNRGEGFCIFNDIAVSANYLLNKNLVKKVLVIDLDVHQGNGTAEIFNNNNRVFTFSVHGKNNYPLQKERSDLDIELVDLTQDKEYLKIIGYNVPKLIHQECPDIVYYLAGADILESDKFGRLSVSIDGAEKRDEIVFEECRNEGIPIVCVMGGGYSKDLEIILEAHLNTFKVGKSIYG